MDICVRLLIKMRNAGGKNEYTRKARAAAREEDIVGQQQLVFIGEVLEHVLHGLRQPRLQVAQHRRLEHQLCRSVTLLAFIITTINLKVLVMQRKSENNNV